MLIEKGIDADKIMVLVNAFPPEAKQKALSVSFDELQGNFLVLYSGGMGLANELMTVIKAARILQDKNVPIVFLFVGEGDRKAEYIEYCQQNGIDNCRFLPVLPRSEMPTLLSRVNLCVHSLKANPFWSCALSSKVFDYLAYGKPVVFAGQGDIADLLEASGGGISVPPENPDALAGAIQKLYEDPALREWMGTRGAQYVKNTFSHEALRACLARAFSA